MFKKILIVLLVIVAAFAGMASLQPDDFKVERSATIAATPATLFEQVNDFHRWEAWSPWAKLDPNATIAYEGSPVGEGAVMKWDGNNEVGKGSMTITESVPGDHVTLRLDFEKPMHGTNTGKFTFKPEGDKTLVTWSMEGKNNFMAKAISMVMDCEKMVGEQFDKGLANMKAVVETPAQPTAAAPAAN